MKKRRMKGGIKGLLYSQKVAPYIFVLPFVLSFCLFWIYPFFNAVYMSFRNITALESTFTGLDNYRKMLKDTVFFKAVQNSFTYMIWTLILLIPIPMLLAVLMDGRFVKGKGIWKAILYIPALTSTVISGTLFRLMFSEYSTGMMNTLMVALGREPYKWLKNGTTGMAALLTLACWRWTGVNMLYFSSGLKNIDGDIYEAAMIDGANAPQKFFFVTLPLLKPTTIYVLTISIYAGLAMFLESFMLWAGNGGPKNIGLTIVGYLYRKGIESNTMGYACAVGMALLLIALVINMAQLALNGTFKKER